MVVGGWRVEGRKSVVGNYQQKANWSSISQEIRLIVSNLLRFTACCILISSVMPSSD